MPLTSLGITFFFSKGFKLFQGLIGDHFIFCFMADDMDAVFIWRDFTRGHIPQTAFNGGDFIRAYVVKLLNVLGQVI